MPVYARASRTLHYLHEHQPRVGHERCTAVSDSVIRIAVAVVTIHRRQLHVILAQADVPFLAGRSFDRLLRLRGCLLRLRGSRRMPRTHASRALAGHRTGSGRTSARTAPAPHRTCVCGAPVQDLFFSGLHLCVRACIWVYAAIHMAAYRCMRPYIWPLRPYKRPTRACKVCIVFRVPAVLCAGGD